MILTQRILLSVTIFACLIAISGISAAQEASPLVQASDSEKQIEIITKILDEIADELGRSDLSQDDVNKRIDQALNLLKNMGESNENFRRAIESAIPSGRKIVNNLMRSENEEKENQRLVATGQAAALILMLTLAHLEDIDQSFTEIKTEIKTDIDSSLVKIQANTDTINKLEERLNSLKPIQIFNHLLTIEQAFIYSGISIFSLSFVANLPISGAPFWLWLIKALWWLIKRKFFKQR